MVSEVKKSFAGLNRRLNTAEEMISKLRDGAKKLSKLKHKQKNMVKKTKHNT